MENKSVKWLDETGFHRLSYSEWGDPDNDNVLICAHGLTRNRHDFDFLAEQLKADYRLICPDFPGRGQSDWLTNKNNYDYPHYLQAFTALLAKTGSQSVTWLGTSMGGVTGMLFASLPGNPISKLILNDIGALIPKSALTNISDYVGKQPIFHSLDALKHYLMEIHHGFGALSGAQWKHMATHSYRKLENGRFTLSYDPDIVIPFKKQSIEEINLWPVWAGIHCPVLIIRGSESEILPKKVALKMATRSNATLIEISKTGHAPALMSTNQIEIISNWLSVTPS